MQVFLQEDGSYDGHCFACGKHHHDPYKDKPAGYKPTVKVKTDEDIANEIAEYEDYPTVTLKDRRLGQPTLELYGIKVGLDQERREVPISHHYPHKKNGKVKAYKNRIIEGKRLWSTGDMSDVDLFGWDVAVKTGNSRLYIVEGELDAPSLYGMIMNQQKNTEYADRHPAVVSLTKGSSHAGNEIAKNLKKINETFKEVVLVFDNDEPGEKAVAEVLKVAPQFKVAKVPDPYSDPNECLVKGASKALIKAVMWQAHTPKNTRLVWGGEVHEAARTQAEWGFSWPWERFNDLTRGIRKGETYYIGAGVKMGKSEIVNALGAHLIMQHGWKIFVAKPEEANNKTYKMMASKIVGNIFHDPKVEFNFNAYDKAGEVLKSKLCMLNLYQEIKWEDLQADIRAAAMQGCEAIFIDPITNLTDHLPAGDANTELQLIAQQASVMALDLNLAIFIFCHLNAPRDGAPHERGGPVLSTQFAGSRAMMRKCNYMIGLQGNKDPELSQAERNLRELILLEDREFGESGGVQLAWNPNTSLFAEV